MLKIGITGGIGSGKTMVCTIFKNLGIPVYNADFRAKVLVNTNPRLIDKIKHLFGENSYIENSLNNKYIASIVFQNKQMLENLNAIVHPAVEEDFQLWSSTHSNYTYVIKEAAVLFESNTHIHLDKTIVIDAPYDVRIKRVIKRDNTTKNKVIDRIKNQWPADKIKSLADFLIKNDGKELILPQIIKIDAILKK